MEVEVVEVLVGDHPERPQPVAAEQAALLEAGERRVVGEQLGQAVAVAVVGRAQPAEVVEAEVVEPHLAGVAPERPRDAPAEARGRVADADHAVAEHLLQRLGDHAGRVREVDQPGAGGALGHGLGQSHHLRDRAQREADAARPRGLLAEHAVGERHRLVDHAALEPADADRREDEVGALDRVGEVGRRAERQGRPALGGEALEHAADALHARRVEVVQDDLVERERLALGQQGPVHERDPEPAAADDRELHAVVGLPTPRHRLDVDVGQRVGVVGGAQAVGGVAGDHAAAADQADVLAQLLGLLEVVRGQQDRRALGVQAADVAPQLEPQLEVDARRRLVEDHELGLVHERAGEQEAAAHAAGELGRARGRLRAQVEDVDHLARAPARFGAAHAVVAAVVDERLLDVEEAVEVDVLLGEADHPARLGRVVAVAEHARLAGGGADEVADGRDQRRLAGAVGAEQAEELAGRYDEVDGVEREQSVVVPLGKPAELERRRRRLHAFHVTRGNSYGMFTGALAPDGKVLSVTRIVIVDPQPAVRAGLAALLRSEPGLVPVGAAGSAEEALETVARTAPDLVLLEPLLGTGDGLQLIRRITGAEGGAARRRLHRGRRSGARGRAARRGRRRARRQAGAAGAALRGAAHRRPRPHLAPAGHPGAAAGRRGARGERRPRAARDARRPHAGRRRGRHAAARPAPDGAAHRATAGAPAPALGLARGRLIWGTR